MKFKGFISSVGAPVSGTGRDGKEWTKRVMDLGRKVMFDNGRETEEHFLVDYFGDTPQEELLQLAGNRVTLEFDLWFFVRDYTNRDGIKSQFQSITLKSLSKVM